MDILPASDDNSVKYKSSIAQYKNTLSTYAGGVWAPIAFDSLDYIDCVTPHCHLACVTDGEDLGYHYKVGETFFEQDTYLVVDQYGTELRVMETPSGDAYYRTFINGRVFTNTDDGAVGFHEATRLNVGLNYAIADNTLEATE